MQKDADAETFQLLFKVFRRRLTAVLCNDDASDIKSDARKSVVQSKNVGIVRDTEVTAHFVLFDIRRIDDHNDLDRVGDLLQHLHLDIGCKPGENARRMIIVEQLSAEFKIQLSAEFLNALAYLFRLLGNIKFLIKPDFPAHKYPRRI